MFGKNKQFWMECLYIPAFLWKHNYEYQSDNSKSIDRRHYYIIPFIPQLVTSYMIIILFAWLFSIFSELMRILSHLIARAAAPIWPWAGAQGPTFHNHDLAPPPHWSTNYRKPNPTQKYKLCINVYLLSVRLPRSPEPVSGGASPRIQPWRLPFPQSPYPHHACACDSELRTTS